MAESGSATASRNSATRRRSRATSGTSCRKSNATGGPVRGADWPGVPDLPPHRLLSPRVGTLRGLAAVSGTLVVALAALNLRDPLASMSSYTAALMALNQIAPPLLLLALPRTIRVSLRGHGKGAALASLLLDPWAATT